MPGPFRLADLPDWFRVRGYSDELACEKTLQGTAMRRRGVPVGNFFLAGKEDAPEFSAADEEMLELFASQAAAAIVNARLGRLWPDSDSPGWLTRRGAIRGPRVPARRSPCGQSAGTIRRGYRDPGQLDKRLQ